MDARLVMRALSVLLVGLLGIGSAGLSAADATTPESRRLLPSGDGAEIRWPEPGSPEAVARDWVRAMGGTRLPPPSSDPRMAQLPAAEQAQLWRRWAGEAGRHATQGLHLGTFTAIDYERAYADGGGSGGSGAAADPVTKAFGMRPVWSLELYGVPLEILSVGTPDHYVVVTTEGVVQFPVEEDAEPSWATKLPHGVYDWGVGDANGDGVRDVFVQTLGFMMEKNDPTMVVVDGSTGAVLFEGLGPAKFLPLWTVSDVDADGKADILGVTSDGSLTARSVTGKEIYDVPLPGPLLPSFDYMVYVDPDYPASLAWGDVDGDGASDLVVGYDYQAGAYAGMPLGAAASQTSIGGLFVVAGAAAHAGELVWETDPRVFEDYDGPFGLAVADLDGDKKADPVLWGTDYMGVGAFVLLGEAYGVVRTDLVEAFDGATGELLLRDDRRALEAGPGDLSVPLTDGPDYAVRFVEDVNADGRAEIVVSDVSHEGDALRRTFVGRGVPTERGDPSIVLWERTIQLDGFNEWDLYVRPLDVDGNGAREIVAHALAAKTDDDGQVEDVTTRVFILGKSELQTVTPPDNLLFWSVAADAGRAFGYVLERDRWSALAPDGSALGDGVRFDTYLGILDLHDNDGDGAEDLLVSGATGVRWLDGRTGASEGEVIRPLLRSTYGALDEKGRVRLLERDLRNRDYVLVDLRTQADLWHLSQEDLEDAHWATLRDANADGYVDALYSVDEGEKRRTKIKDARSKQVLWESGKDVDGVSLIDLLPARAGSELLLRVHHKDGPIFALARPEGTDTDWAVGPVKDLDGWGGGKGYFHYTTESRGKSTTHVLDPATGEERFTWKRDEEKEHVFSWEFLPMRAASPPDLVSVQSKDREATKGVTVAVRSGADGEELATFGLGKPPKRTFYFMGSAMEVTLIPGLEAAVGDWGGSLGTDLALGEDRHLTVRDGTTGEPLASMDPRVYLISAIDLDGNDAKELLTGLPTGRLTLMTADASVEPTAFEDGVEVVNDPSDPRLQPLETDDRSLLPGPGPWAFLVAVGAAGALWGRRRAS